MSGIYVISGDRFLAVNDEVTLEALVSRLNRVDHSLARDPPSSA